jgi:hypothetical protein
MEHCNSDNYLELFESIKKKQIEAGLWTGVHLRTTDSVQEGTPLSVSLCDMHLSFNLRNYQKAALKWMVSRERGI